MNCFVCLEKRIFSDEGKVIPVSKIPSLPLLEMAIWFCDDCITDTLKECIGHADLFQASFLHRARVRSWKKQREKEKSVVELALTIR